MSYARYCKYIFQIILVVVVLVVVYIIQNNVALSSGNREPAHITYPEYDITNSSQILAYIEIPGCSTDYIDLLKSSSIYPCVTSSSSIHVTSSSDHVTSSCLRPDGTRWLASDTGCGTGSLISYETCSKLDNINVFYGTWICDPIARYLQEFYHRRDRITSPYSTCHDRRTREQNTCRFTNTLDSFISCKDNPADNRMTRSLSDVTCNIGGSLSGLNPYTAEYFLTSAVRSLYNFSILGVDEFMLTSAKTNNMLNYETLDINNLTDTPIYHREAASEMYNLTGRQLAKIRENNKYDVRLYYYVLGLVAARAEYAGDGVDLFREVEFPTNVPVLFKWFQE